MVDDVEYLVEAMIMYMYGADNDAVLAFARELSLELRREVGDKVSHETDLEHSVQSNAVANCDEDPAQWQSRVASEVSIDLVQLYCLADKYNVWELKNMLYLRLRAWINTAWSHSDVLKIIDIIISSVPEKDALYYHIVDAIRKRLDTLTAEWRFIDYIKTQPELHLMVGDMTIAMVAKDRTMVVKGTRQYCCYSAEEQYWKHCRYNTIWKEHPKTKRLTCSNCGQDGHGSPEKIRLWEKEGAKSNPPSKDMVTIVF